MYKYGYNTNSRSLSLSVYLIERSCIAETAVPHLVHNLCSMHIILDAWARHQAKCRASPHAVLQLFRDAPLILGEKLAGEAALARQGRCPDLQVQY